MGKEGWGRRCGEGGTGKEGGEERVGKEGLRRKGGEGGVGKDISSSQEPRDQIYPLNRTLANPRLEPEVVSQYGGIWLALGEAEYRYSSKSTTLSEKGQCYRI